MKSALRRATLLLGISCLAMATAAQAGVGDQATSGGTQPRTPAYAADASSGPSISDIIVTAQKRSERINDVPLTITAASGAQLLAQGITSVGDLAKITPGFQYAQTGINSVYTLRGIGFYDNTLAARGAVAVYVDEVALPFAVLTPVAPFDLERVEVLKGPQGTLFGQNSTGGAINYIAAKPTRDLTAGLSGEVGRFARGSLEAFVSGPITSTLAARVAVRTEFGGDWQRTDSRSNDNTLGQRQSYAGRFQLAWEPTPAFRANLQISGYRNRSDPQAPQYAGTSPLFSSPAFPPSRVLDPLLTPYATPAADNRVADWDAGLKQYQHDDIFLAALRLEADLNDNTTITSISAYSDYRKRAFRDVDGTAILNDNFLTRGDNQVVQQELRLSGGLGSRVNYILGGNYERDKAYQIDRFTLGTTSSVANFYRLFFGTPFTGASAFTDVRYTSKSVFGNIDFEITDALTAHGGIRYTKLDGHGRGCILADDDFDIVRFTTAGSINRNRAAAGLAPISIARGECYTSDGITPGEARPVLDEHNVAWRAGLDWKPRRDFLFYANVSKGYKSGSFPQVPGTNTLQFNAATQESVLAYEAGMKISLLDRRVQANGALFYYDYADKQFLGRTVTLTGVAPILVNVPESSVKGAELQIDWQVVPGLRLTAAGTYLDSKVGDFTNYDAFGVIRNFKGNRFPFAPKFQATFDGQYDFGLTDTLSGFVGASATHQTSTYSAFGELPFLYIKGYETVDARFGIENKEAGWRVGMYVRNLTNTYYWNNVIRAADTVVRYTGLPRTFGLTFSIRR